MESWAVTLRMSEIEKHVEKIKMFLALKNEILIMTVWIAKN